MGIFRKIINFFDFYSINRQLYRMEKRLNKSPLFRDEYFGIGEYVIMPKEFYESIKDSKKEA